MHFHALEHSRDDLDVVWANSSNLDFPSGDTRHNGPTSSLDIVAPQPVFSAVQRRATLTPAPSNSTPISSMIAGARHPLSMILSIGRGDEDTGRDAEDAPGGSEHAGRGGIGVRLREPGSWPTAGAARPDRPRSALRRIRPGRQGEAGDRHGPPGRGRDETTGTRKGDTLISTIV